MPTLLRAVIWQRLDLTSVEHFRLWETPDGCRLDGTVVLALDGVPLETRYTIGCSRAWETRSVQLELVGGVEFRTLELTADDVGTWRLDGRRMEALDGCVDVDLAITPATNTLPIRRLGLAVGDAQDATAAWIRFPALTVETLPQRYLRTAERRYRYESRGGSFVRELDVDELGLVVRYPGLWESRAAYSP